MCRFDVYNYACQCSREVLSMCGEECELESAEVVETEIPGKLCEKHEQMRSEYDSWVLYTGRLPQHGLGAGNCYAWHLREQGFLRDEMFFLDKLKNEHEGRGDGQGMHALRSQLIVRAKRMAETEGGPKQDPTLPGGGWNETWDDFVKRTGGNFGPPVKPANSSGGPSTGSASAASQPSDPRYTTPVGQTIPADDFRRLAELPTGVRPLRPAVDMGMLERINRSPDSPRGFLNQPSEGEMTQVESSTVQARVANSTAPSDVPQRANHRAARDATTDLGAALFGGPMGPRSTTSVYMDVNAPLGGTRGVFERAARSMTAYLQGVHSGAPTAPESETSFSMAYRPHPREASAADQQFSSDASNRMFGIAEDRPPAQPQGPSAPNFESMQH